MCILKQNNPLLLCFLGCFFALLSCQNKNSDVAMQYDEPELVENIASKKVQISPILIGTNVWYIDPTEQVWDLTEKSGVASIRIGGHAYDDNVPSKKQLLNWVKKIQSIGAEPILQVSQYESPEHAADLVHYFNVELASGKAIKYWNIGNEPWLQNKKPDLSTVGKMVESYFKPRAEAMKSIDPTIKIYGPDLCYYIDEAMNDLFGGKNDISIKIPGKDYYYCDGISWHRYPQDESINLAFEGIEDFEKSIIKCKAKVDFVNDLHKRSGENALGWSLGEYNAKGGPQVHTWENGQMFAGVLNLCMKYKATFATSWSMFEHNGDRKGSDFSFIDGTNMVPRPTYRHMEMLANNFNGYYLDGKSDNKNLFAFGSKDGDKISVMVVNRGTEDVDFYLNLNNDTNPKIKNTVKINIDGNSKLFHQGNIKGLSTHTYIFQNNKIEKSVYSNEHFKNEKPTETTIL